MRKVCMRDSKLELRILVKTERCAWKVCMRDSKLELRILVKTEVFAQLPDHPLRCPTIRLISRPEWNENGNKNVSLKCRETRFLTNEIGTHLTCCGLDTPTWVNDYSVRTCTRAYPFVVINCRKTQMAMQVQKTDGTYITKECSNGQTCSLNVRFLYCVYLFWILWLLGSHSVFQDKVCSFHLYLHWRTCICWFCIFWCSALKTLMRLSGTYYSLTLSGVCKFVRQLNSLA